MLDEVVRGVPDTSHGWRRLIDGAPRVHVAFVGRRCG